MSERNGRPVVQFSEPEDVGPRPWGREILIGLIPKVCMGKLLLINKGSKGGLQKHQLKDEAHYLYAGKLLYRFDDGSGQVQEKVLEAGSCVHVPPGAVHQEEALDDCILFEISTPHFNDRVRMEEDYGQPKGEGLPSTELEEIEVR